MAMRWRSRGAAALAAMAVGLMAGTVAQGRPVPLGRAGGAVGGPQEPAGLHLPRERQVSFNTVLTDGGNYRWDLQHYLNVGQGTNYVYSGGVYSQVNGNNISSNGQGWSSAAGDEIEIGPWSPGNDMTMYRRCKVYKDQAVARWLDIYVNTGSAARALDVRIYSCYNAMVSIAGTSGGGADFTEKDWAFVTDQQGRPALLHVVCGARSKLRPTVQVEGNQLYVTYRLEVPSGGVAVLAYFESQGKTAEEVTGRMKELRFETLLKDLPPAVRKLVVNFPPSGDFEPVELPRSAHTDAVVLTNGDPIFGTITSERFRVQTFYGAVTLAAKDVLGMVRAPGAEAPAQMVLAGGQVVCGQVPQETLRLELPTGGALEIPFARIRQWSFRISPERPAETPMTDPLLVLRTGDRLAFDPAALTVTFQTQHGPVALNAADLLEVRLGHETGGVHRATFRNGSTLAGLLGPERISLGVKLGPTLELEREMVALIRFAAEAAEARDLAGVVLSNEDELWGRLADESLLLATDLGSQPVPILPANVSAIRFDPQDPSRTAVRLWDGSVLRGRLRAPTVRFQIVPGPTLTLDLSQIAALTCPTAAPPEHVVRQIEKLVSLLSAESYQDRQDAQKALSEMRPAEAVIPLLERYQNAPDKEIRERVTAILAALRTAAGRGGPAPQPDWDGQQEMRIWGP